MRHDLCGTLGMEFPLFAFSHCRDVVAAVSRAGGFGVLGGTRFTPESLEEELRWIDAHCGGKPYGVDIVFPGSLAVETLESMEQTLARIPAEHRAFVEEVMGRHGLPFSVAKGIATLPQTTLPEIGEQLLDVAFRHPIRLIANALGVAPPGMIERGRAHGVQVAALVGSKEHAVRQVRAGVDIVVAQGTEAGGHCGDISSMVLVPEVIRAVQGERDVPVLAAGGIVNGRQMAGMMAMGAAGAWTGTVWLATAESEVSESFREKMVEASSRDTVRSRARTGKPCRQLRSDWHAAWEAPDAPEPLGMPLQGLLAIPALNAAERAADGGNAQARALVSYYVGQGVGLIDGVRGAGAVVQQFKEEFADAYADLEAVFA
jgi:NAD(P)H-dependent flavin oxidoreductase YrpB (nitropropane dioxygenase family)